MGKISKWLMHDDQKDLFEVVVASAFNLVFLVLIILMLWPLGRVMLALQLAKGYAVFWLIIIVSIFLVTRIQRVFRVNLYDRANAFVISNLIVSCLLQVGWSAFAAFQVHSSVVGATFWSQLILYPVGVVSCLIAFFAVTA